MKRRIGNGISRCCVLIIDKINLLFRAKTDWTNLLFRESQCSDNELYRAILFDKLNIIEGILM